MRSESFPVGWAEMEAHLIDQHDVPESAATGLDAEDGRRLHAVRHREGADHEHPAWHRGD